jgi:RNA polymerase sigma-70 factor (ECF subfamily)
LKDYKDNIIKKIREGDSNSFRLFVDEYKSKAYSLCIKILKNPEDAEDALQESFLKLFRAITDGQFEEKSKLSTYFYTIVYNTAVDNYKKIKKINFGMISIDVEDSDFSEGDELTSRLKENLTEKTDTDIRTAIQDKHFAEKEIKELVDKYIKNLPEQYSIILNMFYLNDMSYEEITQILKLPIGTVKNRLFRAKEKLRDIILQNYSEEEIYEYV